MVKNLKIGKNLKKSYYTTFPEQYPYYTNTTQHTLNSNTSKQILPNTTSVTSKYTPPALRL